MSALLLLALALPAHAGPVALDVPTEPVAPPSQARLLLNSATIGAGLGLAGASLYNLSQAREAYTDYLDEPDTAAAETLLSEQVRPRQVAAIAEAGGAVLALGTGALLWATTEGLEGPAATPSRGRHLLNVAVLGGGAASSIAAVYNYAQAREVYADYLAEPDEAAANTLYEQELRPRQRAVAVEGALGLAALGAGTALWLGTENVELRVGLGQLGLEGRW